MSNTVREETFVNTFVDKAKRERYKTLLASAKNRKKILDALNYNFDFDEALAIKIHDHQIIDRLRKWEDLLIGEDACYLISDDHELDGKARPFIQALELARASRSGTILDCIPGVLALYWDEADPSRACLLLQAHKNPVQSEF